MKTLFLEYREKYNHGEDYLEINFEPIDIHLEQPDTIEDIVEVQSPFVMKGYKVYIVVAEYGKSNPKTEKFENGYWEIMGCYRTIDDAQKMIQQIGRSDTSSRHYLYPWHKAGHELQDFYFWELEVK